MWFGFLRNIRKAKLPNNVKELGAQFMWFLRNIRLFNICVKNFSWTAGVQVISKEHKKSFNPNYEYELRWSACDP